MTLIFWKQMWSNVLSMHWLFIIPLMVFYFFYTIISLNQSIHALGALYACPSARSTPLRRIRSDALDCMCSKSSCGMRRWGPTFSWKISVVWREFCMHGEFVSPSSEWSSHMMAKIMAVIKCSHWVGRWREVWYKTFTAVASCNQHELHWWRVQAYLNRTRSVLMALIDDWQSF